MTTTPSVSNASAPYDPTQSTAAAEGGGALEKESFMKLLVTQLSAQDPLNPADSTEFVNQLTQFTSMEQLVNIKEGLDLLAVTETAGTSAQMVSFIGQEVSFSADTFVVDEMGEKQDIDFTLPQNADSVEVVVKDENGKVVSNESLGSMKSGAQHYDFDGLNDEGGKLPEGTYTFEVVAKDKDGVPINATTQSTGIVDAVVFENGYPELLMEDGRKITLSQVVKVVNGDKPATGSYGQDQQSTASTIAALMDHMDSPMNNHEDEALRMF